MIPKDHFVIVTFPCGYSVNYAFSANLAKICMDLFIAQELVIVYGRER